MKETRSRQAGFPLRPKSACRLCILIETLLLRIFYASTADLRWTLKCIVYIRLPTWHFKDESCLKAFEKQTLRFEWVTTTHSIKLINNKLKISTGTVRVLTIITWQNSRQTTLAGSGGLTWWSREPPGWPVEGWFDEGQAYWGNLSPILPHPNSSPSPRQTQPPPCRANTHCGIT